MRGKKKDHLPTSEEGTGRSSLVLLSSPRESVKQARNDQCPDMPCYNEKHVHIQATVFTLFTMLSLFWISFWREHGTLIRFIKIVSFRVCSIFCTSKTECPHDAEVDHLLVCVQAKEDDMRDCRTWTFFWWMAGGKYLRHSLCALDRIIMVQKTKTLFRAAELRANHVLRQVLWLMCIASGISSKGNKSLPESAMPHVILFHKMHCNKHEGLFLGKQGQKSKF